MKGWGSFLFEILILKMLTHKTKSIIFLSKTSWNEKEEYKKDLKNSIYKKIEESGLIEQEFRKKISLSYNYLNSNNIKSKYFNNSPELM